MDNSEILEAIDELAAPAIAAESLQIAFLGT
jgi:hypothetical protein